VLSLLCTLDPHHTHSPEEIAHVLDRWSKVEPKNYKGEDEEGLFTHLSLRDELRCLIASLYSRRSMSAKSGPRVFVRLMMTILPAAAPFTLAPTFQKRKLKRASAETKMCLYLRCSKIVPHF
jgi:hypothetical protein